MEVWPIGKLICMGQLGTAWVCTVCLIVYWVSIGVPLPDWCVCAMCVCSDDLSVPLCALMTSLCHYVL